MSGKFIPAGSLDQTTERDSEWEQARQELDAKQKERKRTKIEHDGKSLFEVLQANRAAKEEAFQESIKLKNQFRALNDDEVEFLDSQAEVAKAKEQAVRQETSEQLELFRQKQYAANKAVLESATAQEDKSDEVSADIDINWTASKKRKRVKQKESIKSAKVHRSISEMLPNSDSVHVEADPSNVPQGQVSVQVEAKSSDTSAPVAKKQGSCLVDYGSDEESDSDDP